MDQCMPNKEQLSEEVNEVLGTDMEFDRLLEEDLELFHELVLSGNLTEPLAKQYVKEHSKEKLDEEIDEWYPGKFAGKIL